MKGFIFKIGNSSLNELLHRYFSRILLTLVVTLKKYIKKKTPLIFSYRLLHSFLLPLGPQEKKKDNSLLVIKHYWGVRDFRIVGGSIKMGGGVKFLGGCLTPSAYYDYNVSKEPRGQVIIFFCIDNSQCKMKQFEKCSGMKHLEDFLNTTFEKF